MSVEFEDPTYTSTKKIPKKEVSFASLMVGMGLGKDEHGAKVILIVVVALCVVISAGLFFLTQTPPGQVEDMSDTALVV